MDLWELVSLLGTSNHTWEGGVFSAILLYQSHLAGGWRTEVFFVSCLYKLVLCVGFGGPTAGQVADQISNLFFHPSPTVSCPSVKTEKSSKGRKEKWVGSPESLGNVKATGENCKAKYSRDMYQGGMCWTYNAGSREMLFRVKKESSGTLNCRKSRFSSSAPQEQLVFRAWQYCIVVKCVWKDWFIAIMIYESPPDTYLRGCGGVQ